MVTKIIIIVQTKKFFLRFCTIINDYLVIFYYRGFLIYQTQYIPSEYVIQMYLPIRTSKLQIMKRFVFFLTLATLVLSGCRKEADYHPYIGETGDLAYDSYSSQFDYLWKCMSTGYVFWDVDETDWDAVYDEYMPKFQVQKYQ